jgi:hypothetical protein
MSRYPEIDPRKIKTVSVKKRRSLVSRRDLYRIPKDLESFAGFWDSLPDSLGARDLRAVVGAVLRSRRRRRPVLVLCGAHVLKTGMGPGLIRWIDEKILTGIAFHGAGAIHDVELALFGVTSEDVPAKLHTGQFGMARETASFVNDAARLAARSGTGFGEALGWQLLRRDRSAASRSVLAAAYAMGVPATVHVAVGTDIVHPHASFDGAATGEASARDFRILAAQLMEMRGATVLNLGSAVVLPEVFLKAFSAAVNLGANPDGLTTAAFDFIRHYRPMENIVHRPTQGVGRGYFIVGQHEILLPLLFHATLRGTRTARPRRAGR